MSTLTARAQSIAHSRVNLYSFAHKAVNKSRNPPAQRQIGRHKPPLLVTHITRIANLPLVPHPSMLRDLNKKTAQCLQNGIKVITGSSNMCTEGLCFVVPLCIT